MKYTTMKLLRQQNILPVVVFVAPRRAQKLPGVHAIQIYTISSVLNMNITINFFTHFSCDGASTMSSYHQDGATPLANLCQKAGSTLDEILALEEDELEELSKEIVGNGVLDHARILRQFRRCKLEENLRNELEIELANEGQDVEEYNEPQVREEVQEDIRIANDIREKAQHDVIGQSWEEYLRKQIRVEMQESEPPPVKNIATGGTRRSESEPPPVKNIITGGTRTTASEFTDENSADDYETFVESITIDPSLLSDDYDEEEKTTYNPLEPLGAVAEDMMGFIEVGINNFFNPPELPKKKKKKKPPKSFFESGMEFLYPSEEPERRKSSKKKKENKSLLHDGLAYFVDDSCVNKENNRQKSKKRFTKSRSSKWMRQREPKEQTGETFKLVRARSLGALQARHKFHC